MKKSPEAKYIYVVLTAGHELDTGSGYFYGDAGDSMSKETYDTQIVTTFVNKASANQRAKAEAEMVCEDSAKALSHILDVVISQSLRKLLFSQILQTKSFRSSPKITTSAV